MKDIYGVPEHNLSRGDYCLFEHRSARENIYSAIADYIMNMKEVAGLILYIKEDNSNNIVLEEYRNIHPDFSRNLLRIKITRHIAQSIITYNSITELKNTNLSNYSKKFGLSINKGFIGIPIKEKGLYHSEAKGTLLVWTCYLNKFDEYKMKFLVSATNYLSHSIDWGSMFATD